MISLIWDKDRKQVQRIGNLKKKHDRETLAQHTPLHRHEQHWRTGNPKYIEQENRGCQECHEKIPRH